MRSRLPLLLTAAALSVLIGAGSVFAAMPRPRGVSALRDFDTDAPALKAADLDRALAAGGASPERVVVSYTNGFVDQATLERVHALVGGTPLSADGVLGREVLRLASGDAAAAVERVRGVAGVAEVRTEQTLSVEAGQAEPPKAIGEPDAGAPRLANDPYAAYAWGVARVGANHVWATDTGGGVKVAVLDCGIHATHPDLAGQVILEKNFSASSTTDDRCNHGTHVAGIIAALTNNGVGVPSVAPGARLLNGKVADDAGHGFFSDFETGLRWAADNGARVVNLSLGANIPCAASTQAAVTYARSKGVVIVAAAGNSALGRAASPANCSGVVGVGAVDQNELRASFSNTGAGVLLAAPGVRVGSTVNPDVNGGALYALMSGTSMAAPHVAAVAALLWASGYGTSVDSVIGRLESSADRIVGTGSLWAYGRVDAFKAVGAPTRAAPPATATEVAAPPATSTEGHAPPSTATEVAAAPLTAAEVPATPTAVPTDLPATATAVPTRAPATAAAVPPKAVATATPHSGALLTTPPTGVTAMPAGPGQVQILWQASVDSRTTFNVYRGDANGQDMRLLGARIASTPKQFVDRAVPLGQTVTYSVAAQNAAGEGPHSAPIQYASPAH